MSALPPIGRGVAEVVEAAVGDAGEADEALIREDVEGALAELAGGGAGEGAVEGIEFGQEHGILGQIATLKGVGRPTAVVAYPSRSAVLRDQAGDLGAGEAADLDQVIPDDPLVGLAEAQVTELTERGLDPAIGLRAGGYGEVQR